MEVAIIGSVGIPANYGGFETLVEQVVRNSRADDIQYTIYCSRKAYKEFRTSFEGAKLKYINLKANGLQSIPYDILSLLKAVRHSDEILMLGVSGCIFLPILRLFSKKILIINIDGLEHRRGKWNKWVRRFLKYSESKAIKYGDIIIADNKGIADYVIDEYGITPEVIAYGGDHAIENVSKEDSENILNGFGLTAGNYAMALCRIEPENNVELILESFSKVPDKKLIFIGNWDRNEYSRELKNRFSRFRNIRIQSSIYDLKILNALRSNCNCYIHGHSAGGTNPSLVEAMFFGKPVIAFDCVYNRETTENQAVYFKDSADLCQKLTDLSVACPENGKAMNEIANRRYKWEVIVGQYEDIFHKIPAHKKVKSWGADVPKIGIRRRNLAGYKKIK